MIHQTGALVKRFALNTAGRDLIVGDIHGHFSKLADELARVGFNQETDRLFSVGDLVDRGPESHDVLRWLDKPWFHAVSGNHEDKAIRWPHGRMDPVDYAKNGGAWNIGNLPQERIVYADALAALPVAIQIETETGLVGVVHADCPLPDWHAFTAALEDPATSKGRLRALVDTAQWSRDRMECKRDGPVAGVRAVVVGHQPVEEWTSLDNVIYIDTGAWLPPHRGKGKFTLLDAKTLRPACTPSILQW